MTDEKHDYETNAPPESASVVKRVLRAVPLSDADVREYALRFEQFEYAHDFHELELVNSGEPA